METKIFHAPEMTFEPHPKFDQVWISVLVNGKETGTVSVCVLEIAPGIEIPVHTHDPQVDSIYIAEGQGQAYVNGQWQPINQGDYLFVPEKIEHGIRNTGSAPLFLFVHHSPPLL